MADRTPRRQLSNPRHGLGREVDDEELFGHLYLFAPPRSAERPLDKSPRQNSLPTQRRPRSFSCEQEKSPKTKTKNHKDSIPEKRTAQDRPVKRSPEKSVEQSRKGLPYPPRRYEDVVASFAVTRDVDMLHGAPRLSALAVNAARIYTKGGHFFDLSSLPDEFVYDILSLDSISPELLKRLEELNPSRANVLDAIWARLCFSKYDEKELPAGVNWWRALYELRVRQENGRLERATKKMRLGYNKAQEDREKRRMGKTRVMKVEGRRRRASTGSASGSMGLLARMRMEFRRERGRR
ncbi:RNA polymerase 2 transcription factor S3 (Elongin) [Gracilaria domingensis]|nr:RNA polymerase 2 transcription factor S3 (Elongin) [Gracilaria domingensis]